MNDDIHFGEVEETAPQRCLRPDQNRHYAVVGYESPSQNDLPIYVDVDVMRDMEAHATSNPNVELGGVMLGGQYEDEEGNPFVVISDSLRAEHYEATKGSFKFTHETWSDITKKREEFPDDLQMVGWYHTHPGWGVFLSGMDTFICEHFFNRALDVALVIDPCQSERAFFQWTLPDGRTTRPTSGFFLTGSRFRLPELEIYSAQLEGRTIMPNDPRYSGVPSAYPPPMIHVGEPRSTWMSLAVLGMLTMQFLVLALIAWRILLPDETAPAPRSSMEQRELAAQRAMLDRVIGDLQVAPEGLVQSLEEQRRQSEESRSVNLGLMARIRELDEAGFAYERKQSHLGRQNEELQRMVARLKEDKTEARSEIDQLKDRLEEYEPPEDADQTSGVLSWLTRWKWWLGGGILALLAAAAAAFAFHAPAPGTEHHQTESQSDS